MMKTRALVVAASVAFVISTSNQPMAEPAMVRHSAAIASIDNPLVRKFIFSAKETLGSMFEPPKLENPFPYDPFEPLDAPNLSIRGKIRMIKSLLSGNKPERFTLFPGSAIDGGNFTLHLISSEKGDAKRNPSILFTTVKSAGLFRIYDKVSDSVSEAYISEREPYSFLVNGAPIEIFISGAKESRSALQIGIIR